MAENKYAKKAEEKPVEKEAIKPITKTAPKIKKKGVGAKFKEFIFSGDAREVKNDLIKDTVIPAIKDGIYEVITGFFDGMLYGEGGGGKRRKRRSSSSSYEKTSYTNYYKTSSRDRDVEDRRSRSTRLDLDCIEFCDPDKSQRENWSDATEVKYGMINRINKYTDGASVQDLYDFCGMTCPDWLGVDYGWDDADEFEEECIIKKVRGGAIMSLPAPKKLGD